MPWKRWSHTLVAAATLLGAATLARPGGTQPAPPSAGGGALGAVAPGAPAGIDPAPIDDAIQKLAAEVRRLGGAVGVHVIDVRTGSTIAALDEHRAFNPASNAKLMTAAAALRVLGGQHRFLTGLYGRIDDDRIDELVLRGDGDPSLRTPDLWAMAGELRAAGRPAGARHRGGSELLRRALRAARVRAAAGRVGAVPRARRGGLARREHGALLRARREGRRRRGRRRGAARASSS